MLLDRGISVSDLSSLSENFLKVEVFFEDLNYKVYAEEASYPVGARFSINYNRLYTRYHMQCLRLNTC